MTHEPTQDAALTTDQLAALGTAGLFVEQRIARGALAHGEREASDSLMARLGALATPTAAASAVLEDAGVRLPDDALDRLNAVNGISDALAQKALDALTK